MILPSAPPPRHRDPEPPTLADLAPKVSFFRLVTLPLLALLLLLGAGHWVAGTGLSFADVSLRVTAAALWLHDRHAGSVAFFVAAATLCFTGYVSRAMSGLGLRESELLLSRLPWSRIEAVLPAARRSVQAALRGATVTVGVVMLMLMAPIFFALAAPGTPGLDGDALDGFLISLIPAEVLAFLATMWCFELSAAIERRTGDAQLVCPTQGESLSAQILAAHAAGHFDTPQAQAAFEAWQLRRKPG